MRSATGCSWAILYSKTILTLQKSETLRRHGKRVIEEASVVPDIEHTETEDTEVKKAKTEEVFRTLPNVK